MVPLCFDQATPVAPLTAHSKNTSMVGKWKRSLTSNLFDVYVVVKETKESPHTFQFEYHMILHTMMLKGTIARCQLDSFYDGMVWPSTVEESQRNLANGKHIRIKLGTDGTELIVKTKTNRQCLHAVSMDGYELTTYTRC